MISFCDRIDTWEKKSAHVHLHSCKMALQDQRFLSELSPIVLHSCEVALQDQRKVQNVYLHYSPSPSTKVADFSGLFNNINESYGRLRAC